MASFGVFKEKARISAHPGADRLELAEIGLYKAVVGKGQFQDGEEVFYIPEQAVLPDWLIEEMGLTGKLSGKQANRVKAVRLRGILSQGLVLKLDGVTPTHTGYAYAQPFQESSAFTSEDLASSVKLTVAI